ncbi:hypothetical protein [Burkholderia multivorans]|uniref:hypothetical protein n=1 Tax=Burkholderia multivorans TaxID=87883 RepID=UPI001C22C6B8|nr:hypothetical protein [Burkholderia multivorans]MBU9454717.1 hypothetical protein [Burkholderia multivorans]
MADRFDGTAEQVLAQLMERVGAKARVSLERIKAACDRIEAMRGLMNYSRVAAMATDLFGGPRAQTVQNNRHLKAYIATRISEYHAPRSGGAAPKAGKRITDEAVHYPATDLDAKTKLHIDILRQDNERLARENIRLAQMLEQESLRHPLSLTEALGSGPTDELGLQVELSDSNSQIPRCLLDALEVIFIKQPSAIQVQRRGQSIRLASEVDGVVQTLLSPAQWVEVTKWLKF